MGLARVLESEADRALQVVPLTARGFLALREIRRRAPPTQRDLAHRLHLEPSTLCELLGRLRRAGLVERGDEEVERGVRRGGGAGTCGGTGGDAGRKPGRRPRPPVLTARGAAALRHAERVIARLERDWAARFFAARHPSEDAAARGGPLAPSFGLRRWIAEGLAAFAASPSAAAAPARRRPTPRPKR